MVLTRLVSTIGISLFIWGPILTGVAARAVDRFADVDHNSATGMAQKLPLPETLPSACGSGCMPGDSSADVDALRPPTIPDNALPSATTRSHSKHVRRAMEELSEMAQYFLTDYSPDHADVDFDFALPDGHCSAKLAYISDHGSQTLQIEFMVHGDEGIVGDSSTAIASSKASQEGTLSPASTLRPVVPESTPMSPSRTRTVEITTAIHGEHASKIVDSGVTSTFETFVSDSPSPTVIVAPTVSPTAKPHEEEKRPADHDGQAPTYPLSAGTWVGIALGVGVVLIFLTLAGAHVVYRHSLLPRALRRDREKTAVPTNSVEPYVLEEGNPHQIRSVSRESTSRQFSDWQCDSISARDIPNPSTTTAPASDAIQPGCSNSSEEMDGLGMDLGESDGPPQYEK